MGTSAMDSYGEPTFLALVDMIPELLMSTLAQHGSSTLVHLATSSKKFQSNPIVSLTSSPMFDLLPDQAAPNRVFAGTVLPAHVYKVNQ